MMNTSTNSPIEIMLVSDTKYAPYLATAIVSILKNAAPDDVLRFHLVDGGLTEEDRSRIESLKEVRDCEMIFYKPDLKEYLKFFRQDIQAFPFVSTYRLFVAQYLPQELDKIIYLDVDLVVLTSLRELWEIPVDDAFIAAAVDWMPAEAQHLKDLKLPEGYRYFNSGVMLYNLKRWREDRIIEDLLDISVDIHDYVFYPDQDPINVYGSRVGYQVLPQRWNFHPSHYSEGADARILHFMGYRHLLPNRDILTSYAAMTPYRILPFQKFSYRLRKRIKKFFYQIPQLFLFKREWRVKFRKRFTFR